MIPFFWLRQWDSPEGDSGCEGAMLITQDFDGAARVPFTRRSRCLYAGLHAIAVMSVLLISFAARGQEPKLYATIHEYQIRNVAFSRDGKTLAIRTGDTDLVLWDVASRKTRKKFEKIFRLGNFRMAFLHNGKGVAVNDGAMIFRLDLATGTKSELYRHEDAAFLLVSTPDGRLLASSDAKSVIVWDVVKARKVVTFSPDKDTAINSLGFSPDGRALAGSVVADTGVGKNGIWLWDIDGERKPRFLAGTIGGVTISPDGKSLATLGNEGAILVWDLRSGKLRAKWPIEIGAVTGETFSPNGNLYIAAGGEVPPFAPRGPGVVAFIDTATGKLIKSAKVLPENIGWMSLSPDGKLLAVSTESPSNEMKVFDVSAITATAKKPDDKK
jgi:WD40 repeat protein